MSTEPFEKRRDEGYDNFQRYEKWVPSRNGKPNRDVAAYTWNFANSTVVALLDGAFVGPGNPLIEHHTRQYCRLIQLRDY